MRSLLKPIFQQSIACLLGLGITLSTQAGSPGFDLQKVVQTPGIPWGMAFLDDQQLMFTQRDGKAGILNLKTRQTTWLEGVPTVFNQGQGGLLDVKTAPDYKNSGWIYFTYSQPRLFSAVTTLARAKLKGKALVEWQTLLATRSESTRNIHFGSRIAFDGQGHLFFSVGDRGVRENAQNPSNHAGSILRLNLDGSVPKDNPFVGDPDKRDEIWSYGHRNPQGLAYDPANKRLWAIEHGPRGGDEINRIEPGQNYGWPIVSQGKEYFADKPVGVKHRADMVDPVKVYIPSIAPSSLLLYDGTAFPAWRGDLLAGALVLRHLNHIDLNSAGRPQAETRLLGELNERIRSLAQGPQGALYLATDGGNLYRLTPSEP